MSEPTLYRPTGRYKGLIKRLVIQGALVPVEPDTHKMWTLLLQHSRTITHEDVKNVLRAGIGGSDE